LILTFGCHSWKSDRFLLRVNGVLFVYKESQGTEIQLVRERGVATEILDGKSKFFKMSTKNSRYIFPANGQNIELNKKN